MKREATDLLIRQVDPKLKSELRKRARAHGRSLSDEAKSLLADALEPPRPQAGMGTLMRRLVPAEYRGDDLVFEYKGAFPKPPEFE